MCMHLSVCVCVSACVFVCACMFVVCHVCVCVSMRLHSCNHVYSIHSSTTLHLSHKVTTKQGTFYRVYSDKDRSLLFNAQSTAKVISGRDTATKTAKQHSKTINKQTLSKTPTINCTQAQTTEVSGHRCLTFSRRSPGR